MEGLAADVTIVYRPYVGESDLPAIMALVQSELSEPYVIYTYRYFLQQWCAVLPPRAYESLTWTVCTGRIFRSWCLV